MHLIKDSQGRKSWLITLAIPALIAVTAWFLHGGIDLTLPGGYRVVTATKSGSDFMMFAAPWLSALAWRDYVKKMRLPMPFQAGMLSNVLPYLLGLIGVLVALGAAYFGIKRKGINQEREKWEKAQQESASKRSIEFLIYDHSPDRSAGC